MITVDTSVNFNKLDQDCKCAVNINDMYDFLRSMNKTERTNSKDMEQTSFEC